MRLVAILALLLTLLTSMLLACSADDPLPDDIYTKHIYPAENTAYDLGSEALAYQKGYFDSVYIDGIENPWESEVFFSVTGTLYTGSAGTFGTVLNTNGEYVYIHFHVPHDFTSLTEAVFVVRPITTQAAADWDIISFYGAEGEAYNIHGESDTASTYNVVASQVFEVDISGILSSLAAGDYVSAKLMTMNDAHVVSVGFIRIKYD